MVYVLLEVLQGHVCVVQLFVCVGILIAFAIGLPYDGKEAFLSLASHQVAWWRVMFAVGLVPATSQVRLSCCQHCLQHCRHQHLLIASSAVCIMDQGGMRRITLPVMHKLVAR